MYCRTYTLYLLYLHTFHFSTKLHTHRWLFYYHQTTFAKHEKHPYRMTLSFHFQRAKWLKNPPEGPLEIYSERISEGREGYP